MNDVEDDPNYRLGATRAQLGLIKHIADALITEEIDRDDSTDWNRLWDRIKQIQHISGLRS